MIKTIWQGEERIGTMLAEEEEKNQKKNTLRQGTAHQLG
jgi:hypothetical protein